MTKSIISYFFLLICLIIPQLCNATVAYTIAEKQNITKTSPNDAALIKLDQKALEERLGRKLKWKEKFILRKVKKNQKTSQEDSGAVTGFSISLLSLLLIFLGFLGNLVILILFGYIGGLIGFFVSIKALIRIKRGSLQGKGLAITGLIIGIIISLLLLRFPIGGLLLA